MANGYFFLYDSSWLSPVDVKSLPKHEIDAYLKNTSRKTSGDLYQAYQIAAHPKEWIAEREEERIAEKEGADKKSTPADDEDELAEEEDEEDATAKSGGKRKRIAIEKKATKEKPVSKRAKTDKAPPKKVSFDFGWKQLLQNERFKSRANSIDFSVLFPLRTSPGLALSRRTIFRPRRARTPLTRMRLFPRKPPTLKPPRTARKLLRLPERRLLPLPQRKRPRSPKRPRKMPEMVCVVNWLNSLICTL